MNYTREQRRAQLLRRLEAAHAKGVGVRLSHQELMALMPSKEVAEEATLKNAHYEIRWLIRRDMTDVLKIESASFDSPWTDEDFLSCLRQRNCIGMVVEHERQIVGFMVYEFHKSLHKILRFCVAPEWRRQGAGRAMVDHLQEKLVQQRRSQIQTDVPEEMIEVCGFFAKMGFSSYMAEGSVHLEYRIPSAQESDHLQ